MRSVLISTDLVMKSDGTWTPTEINTNTGHEMTVKNKDIDSPTGFIDNYGDYVNHVEFNQFLQSNNITKIKTIDIKTGFNKVFESFCKYYTNYSHENHEVSEDSVTVPPVEDGDDTLIIRIAYDSYAIVDDLYARDNYEFHNLIKNESFASPVTFNTGDESNIDTITTFEPSIDGVVPNYVVKKRTPGGGATGGNKNYPILYRLDTQEQLDELKLSITSDEFIQRYEFNQSALLDNRTNFIRSVDLLYGSTLEVFNLLTYKLKNAISTQNSLLVYDVEVDENGKLNDLFAGKYYPKVLPKYSLNYHFDETDLILMGDDTDKLAKDLVLGESVKSIYFNDDIINFKPSDVTNLQTFTVGTALINTFEDKTGGIFINISAVDNNGIVYDWYDGLNNFYLLQKSNDNDAQYVNTTAGDIEIGDKIFIYNKSSNEVTYLTIQSISFDIKNINTYIISLEEKKREFFVKITNETSQNELYLIQHNFGCNEWCGVYYNCGTGGGTMCMNCNKANYNCPNCGRYYSPFLCNSDRRLKENIILVGTSENGINIYQFNYIGQEGLFEGVIAQELLNTEFESASVIGDDGMYKVDYSKLDVEFKQIN
jgi:hypothetical protein